jgi:hypothetical protein
LRPGGKLVTVNRIRPGCEVQQKFSEEMADNFIGRVRQAGTQKQASIGIPLATLEKWAREYTLRYRSYPVTSADDFMALFKTQGFALERFDLEGRYNERNNLAPTAPGEALRVLLVAIRE